MNEQHSQKLLTMTPEKTSGDSPPTVGSPKIAPVSESEKGDATAIHTHREVLVVKPIEEEAHEGDVHISLSWRSWLVVFITSFA